MKTIYKWYRFEMTTDYHPSMAGPANSAQELTDTKRNLQESHIFIVIFAGNSCNNWCQNACVYNQKGTNLPCTGVARKSLSSPENNTRAKLQFAIEHMAKTRPSETKQCAVDWGSKDRVV